MPRHASQDGWLDPALRLHPGQQELTLAQEDEVRRFAKAYIQAQLSTEPVDEREAEALLRQSYAVAGLPPPACIHWVNGPLEVLAVVAPESGEAESARVWPRSMSDEVTWYVEAMPEPDLRWRVSERLWDIVEEVSLGEVG